MSLTPSLGFEAHDRAADLGLADGGLDGFLPIQVSFEQEGWGVAAELGYSFATEGDEGFFAGLAGSHELSEDLELAAEVFAELDADVDSSYGAFNVGARYALSDRWSLLGSVGSGLWSKDESRPDFLAFAGVQLAF